MSENNEVSHAFEEWWALMGSKLATLRPAEFDAFAAGAEWQRERDAEAVKRAVSVGWVSKRGAEGVMEAMGVGRKEST